MAKLSSQSVTLTTLVTIDVIWRLPARIIGNVPDWIAPVLSVGAGFSGNPILASFSTWLLFGVSFYVFTDWIYPNDLELPTEEAGFRLLITATGLGCGLLFSMYGGMNDLAVLTLGLFSIVPLGTILLLLYLHFVTGWPLFEADERITGPMQQIDEDALMEYDQWLASDSWAASVNVLFFLLATGMLLVFPCVLLGILAQTLIRAYPLPDLLVLLLMVGNVSDATQLLGSRSLFSTSKNLDIEAQLYDGLDTATRSIKTLFLTMYVLFGTFLGGGTVWMAMVYGSRFASRIEISELATANSGQLLQVWTLIGTFVLLFVAGAYGIGVWLRELKRLSNYAEYRDQGSELAKYSHPPRAVGMTLAPTVILLILGLYVGTRAHAVFAIVWPLAVLGAGICIWLTRRRTGTRIRFEDHIITGSFLIHTLGLLAIPAGETIVTMILQRQFPIESIVSSPVLLIGFILIASPYISTATRYADQFDDSRRHVDGVYLAAFGLISWLITRPAASRLQWFGVAILLFTTGGALLGGIVTESLRNTGTESNGEES